MQKAGSINSLEKQSVLSIFFFFVFLVKFREVFNCSVVSSLCARKEALGCHYVLQRKHAQSAVAEESFPDSGKTTACSEWVTTFQHGYSQEQSPSHMGECSESLTLLTPQIFLATGSAFSSVSVLLLHHQAMQQVFGNQYSRQQADSATLSTKS